ncbi:MAG: DUF2723 domain-containing protein [Anaerolineales bacterium]|nr:DUF2723 domain-containing protein [Anaerolineales bacterium]
MPKSSLPALPPANDAEPAWIGWTVAGLVAAVALAVYGFGLAPGITWAHQGADGGELLTAAVTNGVPHPPGYPLFIPLLQAWLWSTKWLLPAADLAWSGNFFSAVAAAAGVLVTVRVAGHLARAYKVRWLWAALAGFAWATAPLFWSQALLTEVYALHALLVALLGWAVLVHPRQLWYVVTPIALGVAHHLTLVLLLPAVLYWLWVQSEPRSLLRPLAWITGAVAVGCIILP